MPEKKQNKTLMSSLIISGTFSEEKTIDTTQTWAAVSYQVSLHKSNNYNNETKGKMPANSQNSEQ